MHLTSPKAKMRTHPNAKPASHIDTSQGRFPSAVASAAVRAEEAWPVPVRVLMPGVSPVPMAVRPEAVRVQLPFVPRLPVELHCLVCSYLELGLLLDDSCRWNELTMLEVKT